MRSFGSLATVGLLTAVFALPAAAQPSTDIFLLPVDGLTVGEAVAVTDRVGYDNQPKFLADGSAIVYSSSNPDGSTDIRLYDIVSGERDTLVSTPQSEYSPTPIPGRDAISVVRDYGDLKQQLWSFPLGGGEPELLLPDVSPIGYHAWIDESRVLLFVLGDPMMLQVAEIGPGEGTVIAPDPGRGLAKIPGSHEMSFVDKSAEPWVLRAFDPDSGGIRELVPTRPGREDYTWADDGSVWMADGSRLYRWTGEGDWTLVSDLEPQGIYDITRVAFSPDGGSLAVVGRRPPSDLAAAYRRQAGDILGRSLTDEEGWERLTYLSTVIGHRLSGSAGLEQAIEWAREAMEADGLSVSLQSVMVPHWVRGRESARVVGDNARELNILGLGNSVGTPAEGITAEVVVVGSFEEVDALGREGIAGKIVLYAVDWEGYGRTVRFRSAGPSHAAKYGARAVLVRSATGRSLNTPHTGALRYAEDQPQIPAAAVTPKDAAWMRRMAELGRSVTVELKMEAQMLDDAESFNVIAEIPGSQRPEEVVVMGGHYDSWDVGQGVHDDGAACVASWQALKIIHQLGLQPRRTLRVVLWTNEENGLRGGNAYRDALSDQEVADHIAAIEMDGGNERPVGYGFGWSGLDRESEEPDPHYERALEMLQQIGSLLDPIEASTISRGGGGADIGPLMRSGVPGLGLRTVGEHYFDWHHTRADTLDKVDKTDFRRAIALLGVMGYVLADMPERLVPPNQPGSP